MVEVEVNKVKVKMEKENLLLKVEKDKELPSIIRKQRLWNSNSMQLRRITKQFLCVPG
jgi:hypothetical protein